MKALKIAALVVAVLVLALAGLAAYLVTSFDAARIKQELAAAVEKQTGRVLKIEGDLVLAFWPNVAVKLGRTTLSEPGGKAEFARLETASIAVAAMPLLSKQVVVREVAVDGLAATVVKRKDGTLNVADLAGAGQAETVPRDAAVPPAPTFDIAAIRIANARLDWRDEQAGSRFSLADLDLASGPVSFADGRGGIEALTLSARGKKDTDAFTLKLDVPRLVLASGGASGETLKLAATLDGQGRKLAATLTLSGVAGDARSLKIEKFALDADAKIDAVQAVAKLASPVALDLGKQTVALTQLSGQLDLTHPQLPMKTLALPLSGEVSADLAKPSARLRLATRLDASTLKAKVDIGRFAPLALAFDLDIDQLDLDKYLPPGQKQAGSGRAAGKAAEEKIDLSALKGLDLKGTVKIGQLTAAKATVSDIRVQLDAKGGRLNVAPLSANLYDGRLDGALSVDANGHRFAAKQKLAGVRIGPLLNDLADQDVVEGRGDVALDVAAHGATVGALKKSLSGTAKLALADGAIKGIDIGQKLREVKSLLKGGKDVAVAGDATQKTDFSELSASFRIADGVARNDDLLAKSPLLRLAGAGDIDIGNGRLDYLLKTSVVATGTGQGGKDLDAVKGLTIPVRLSGPFEKPDWKIELAGLAGEAAKAKVEEKKEALRQKADKAGDKLKGKLKGLFK